MYRTLIAFLIAPLWVPAIVGALSALVIFPYPEQGHLIALATIIAAIFAYGAALGVAGPGYLAVRSRQEVIGFPMASGVGLVIGWLMFKIFGIWVALALGSSAESRVSALFDSSLSELAWPLGSGAVGALVGATFWFIDRPDREPGR